MVFLYLEWLLSPGVRLLHTLALCLTFSFVMDFQLSSVFVFKTKPRCVICSTLLHTTQHNLSHSDS